MEFIQEPSLTAFLALVLSYVVVKIVSFAVSNTATAAATAAAGEVPGVAEEVKIGRKRVKFVDDVVVRKVDCFQGFRNQDLFDDDDDGGVRKLTVVGEELGKGSVDQLGFHELIGDSGGEEDLGEIGNCCALDEGCGEIGMLVGKVCGNDDRDGSFGANLGVGELENELLDVGSDVGGDEKGDRIVDCGRNEWSVSPNEDKEVEGIGRDESGVSVDDSDGDGDWEGIERSELEKVFAEAVNYVEYGGKRKEKDHYPLVKLGSDVQVELYGLHKAAVEGPCHEPQPMALKVSARARWNAWQRLGSMSPEVAMEHYIQVLSDSVPGWTKDHSVGLPDLESVDSVSAKEHKRELESTSTPGVDSSSGRNSVEPGQKLTCGMDDKL